jgi:hypothetical protein
MHRRHARPNVSTITVFFPPQFPPLGAAERVGSIIPEEAVPNVVYFLHQTPTTYIPLNPPAPRGWQAVPAPV